VVIDFFAKPSNVSMWRVAGWRRVFTNGFWRFIRGVNNFFGRDDFHVVPIFSSPAG